MKAFDNGAFYSVQVSRHEVSAFNRQWPCSQLPDCAITFEFDKRNGDLVDIRAGRNTSKVDGPEAVALSNDAQAFGRARFELE